MFTAIFEVKRVYLLLA